MKTNIEEVRKKTFADDNKVFDRMFIGKEIVKLVELQADTHLKSIDGCDESKDMISQSNCWWFTKQINRWMRRIEGHDKLKQLLVV